MRAPAGASLRRFLGRRKEAYAIREELARRNAINTSTRNYGPRRVAAPCASPGRVNLKGGKETFVLLDSAVCHANNDSESANASSWEVKK